ASESKSLSPAGVKTSSRSWKTSPGATRRSRSVEAAARTGDAEAGLTSCAKAKPEIRKTSRPAYKWRRSKALGIKGSFHSEEKSDGESGLPAIAPTILRSGKGCHYLCM